MNLTRFHGQVCAVDDTETVERLLVALPLALNLALAGEAGEGWGGEEAAGKMAKGVLVRVEALLREGRWGLL
jgi:hypothetical protein